MKRLLEKARKNQHNLEAFGDMNIDKFEWVSAPLLYQEKQKITEYREGFKKEHEIWNICLHQILRMKNSAKIC